MITISTKCSLYIDFIVEFIVVIVSNIILHNIFRYIWSKFRSDRQKKCANLRWPFFSICTPNLEKFKRIFNFSSVIDAFAINF